MYCRGINRKYPLAGDGSWKIWRSYSALGEYGLWKNLKFGEFKEFCRKHELTELLGLRMDATNKIYLCKWKYFIMR